MHYTRWRRHGDPNVIRSHGAPRIEYPTYNTVHSRLMRDRGSASKYFCVECGQQASQWSYDHKDPNELSGTSGTNGTVCRYSANPEHYRALCRICHRWQDAKAAIESRRGLVS